MSERKEVNQIRTLLHPYDNIYAHEIAGWAATQEVLLYWCGETDFPFKPDTFQKWHQEDYVFPYILLLNDQAMAYGELWFDEGEAEIARLIVKPDFRGQGFGQELVDHLVQAARQSGRTKIYMRVFPDNQSALKCYAKAGFHSVSEEQRKLFNHKQPRSYEWLVHHGKEI